MATQDNAKVEQVFKTELSKQFYDIVIRVIVSEKATRLIEFENKMTFEVIRSATKPMVKLLIENEFGKPVKSVNTINNHNGIKVAIVTFKDEGTASPPQFSVFIMENTTSNTPNIDPNAGGALFSLERIQEGAGFDVIFENGDDEFDVRFDF